MATCSIATGKNEVLFIKQEVVPGTAEVLVAADTVNVISAEFNQKRAFTPDNQKRPTVGKIGKPTFHYEVGNFTFTCYIKASGTAGTAPTENEVLKGLFGTETVDGGVSVTYSLRDIDTCPDTFTITRKYGFRTTQYVGCFFDSMTTPVKAGTSDDAIVQMTITGYFMTAHEAGYDNLSAEVDGSGTGTPTVTIPVDDASKYINTPLITIGTDDNAGAGHLIASINYTTNVITLAATMSTKQVDGATVKGWTPVATEAGNLMHGRFQYLTTNTGGGVTNEITAMEANISINNNLIVNNDIKNNSEYPSVSSVTKGEREVLVDFSVLMNQDASRYHYYAQVPTNVAVVAPAGSVAGSKVAFHFPQVRIEPPEDTGDLQITSKINGEALETTGTLNDSVTLVFT